MPASPFFGSFWAAIDGRALSALDRTAASAAFLSALLECTAFIVRRMRSAREKAGNGVFSEDAEKELVRAQYTRAWEECTSKKLRVEEKIAGELVAKSLVRLNESGAGIRVRLGSCEREALNKFCGVGLFDAAWGALVPGMTVPSDSAKAPNRRFVFSSLNAFSTVFVEGGHPRLVVDELFQRIVGGVLKRSRETLLSQMHEDNHRVLDVLLDLISTFGEKLFAGVDQAEVRVRVSEICRSIYILPFV